ncbi:hypothetical protein pclt_cds_957 [Pandoravirus celtis]|uniref:Uncharacterized protein n=1 Tax=Pandoravirus celtis TaxID=2568002 RepID=A0A4D6EJR0_9VIRU|nr:hypothetical protein pclt_cds_957 [Pandoravirus celtis]
MKLPGSASAIAGKWYFVFGLDMHAAARPDTAAGSNDPLDVWMHQQLIKQEAEIETIKTENIRLHRESRRLKVSALVCCYARGSCLNRSIAQSDKISAYGPHKRRALHSGNKERSAFDPSTVESKYTISNGRRWGHKVDHCQQARTPPAKLGGHSQRR